MKIITYSLKPEAKSFDGYYKDIKLFSDIVIDEGIKMTAPWINRFKKFISDNHLEKPLADSEYMLELLTMGVLWLRYSDDGIALNKASKDVLKKLVEMRQKGGALKPGADFARGVLSTLVLYSEHRPELVECLKFSTNNLLKLVGWLEAAGEFVQEVKRIERWLKYLETVSAEETSDLISACAAFALWFEQKSLEELGKYTEGVEEYLKTVEETHRWREDLIFCGRQRLEYHLNMAGAEIMNRAYRNDFLMTSRKAILLPACMRHRLDSCKAKDVEGVLYCADCSSHCQVSAIKSLGDKYGYDVLIVPHESSAFSNSKMKQGELGIIGIACITNLMSGGWKAKSLGIPAQCVLLDYCGCKNHWDEKGFSTAIDMEQLEGIMRE